MPTIHPSGLIWNLPKLWVQCILFAPQLLQLLVAHWLLVAGDHGSNPGGGKHSFFFGFWAVISWLPFTLEFIHDNAKWFIHELIHCVWLSIRLNDLIAEQKTKWAKKLCCWNLTPQSVCHMFRPWLGLLKCVIILQFCFKKSKREWYSSLNFIVAYTQKQIYN